MNYIRAFNKTFIRFLALFIFMDIILVGGDCGGPTPAPAYFTIDDLITGYEKEDMGTDAWFQPPDAIVSLPALPVYAASAGRQIASIRALLANPNYRNKLRILSTNVDWVKTSTYAFDWDRYWNRAGGKKGDLIFNRGTGKGAEVLKRISHWTHVAFAYDRDRVFESMPDGGVKINYTSTSWGSSLTHHTCKRMKYMSSYDVARVVDWGVSNYKGKPYKPEVLNTSGSKNFLYRWGYKNDLNSMYCSKLVYLCFKNNPYAKRNLDTGITGCYSDNSLVENERPLTASVFNWVGVSPDDIYFSDELGKDFCYTL